MIAKWLQNDYYFVIVAVDAVGAVGALARYWEVSGNVWRHLSSNLAFATSLLWALVRVEHPHPASYTCCSHTSWLKCTCEARTTPRNSSAELSPLILAAIVNPYWYAFSFAVLTLDLSIFSSQRGIRYFGIRRTQRSSLLRIFLYLRFVGSILQIWPRAPPASYCFLGHVAPNS